MVELVLRSMGAQSFGTIEQRRLISLQGSASWLTFTEANQGKHIGSVFTGTEKGINNIS